MSIDHVLSSLHWWTKLISKLSLKLLLITKSTLSSIALNWMSPPNYCCVSQIASCISQITPLVVFALDGWRYCHILKSHWHTSSCLKVSKYILGLLNFNLKNVDSLIFKASIYLCKVSMWPKRCCIWTSIWNCFTISSIL